MALVLLVPDMLKLLRPKFKAKMSVLAILVPECNIFSLSLSVFNSFVNSKFGQSLYSYYVIRNTLFILLYLFYFSS